MSHSYIAPRVTRRGLLRAGAGAAVALAARAARPGPVRAVQPAPVTADEALQRLLDGNRRFVADVARAPNRTVERRVEVAGGQNPFALVLGCIDSRVPPEIVFDQGLGDLFVPRVAGPVVDGAIEGSIEFAAGVFGVPLVFVLGHTECGAIKATADAVRTGGEAAGRIADLVALLGPAVMAARDEPGDLVVNAIRANVRLVVAQLKTEEPVLRPLVEAGSLRIVGGVYDLETGAVEVIA
jgi:carbonic anhydrase